MPQTVSTEYLAQLVMVIKQQSQTGLLRIEQIGQHTNEQGEIYFEDGRIFHVRVGDEHGRPALQRISEWAHVMYAFQPRLKPPSHDMPTSARVRQPPEARLLPRSTPFQESNGTRSTRPLPTKNEQAELLASVIKTLPPTLETQPLESAPFTRIKTALPPTRLSQPLVLRGETLEEYIPNPPARMPPARQRWTTHQDVPAPQTALPNKPPVTPRLDSSLGNETLPGQLAIFRAKVTITSPQTMRSMERRERIVFVLLDGRRTLQHIASLLHQSESEIGQILVKLTKIGFAEYVTG